MLEQLHFQLLLLLSVCDIMYACAMLIGDPDTDTGLCKFQAWWSSFADLARLGWVVAIACTLWGKFCREWPDDEGFERKLLVKYALVIFSSSLLISLIPFIGDHYGDSGAWCWIDNSDTGHALRYLTFYLWLWIGFGTICFFYYQIALALASLTTSPSDDAGCCGGLCRIMKVVFRGDPDGEYGPELERIRGILTRLCLYPLVMVLCWSFASVDRLQHSFSPDDPSIMLTYLHLIFANLNGFVNAVVYGFNETLRGDLKSLCCNQEEELELAGPRDIAVNYELYKDKDGQEKSIFD